jgi:hypothetical protein
MPLHHLFTVEHLTAAYDTFRILRAVMRLALPGKGKHRGR